jgi:hypothetical protein
MRLDTWAEIRPTKVNVMPLINGTYYMNPQYGRGLERAKAADAEVRSIRGEPEPSWLDLFLGLVTEPPAAQHDKDADTMQNLSASEDQKERPAVSYSEKTDGTVAEHEAIQSTIMNRVASGERQYVDKGKPVNEFNVVHASKQYRGVGKRNFSDYQRGIASGPGARNAAMANENLRRTGKPTNDATFFIVNPGGEPPTDQQVHRLGNVVPAGRVGDVYLYKPNPPAGTRH